MDNTTKKRLLNAMMKNEFFLAFAKYHKNTKFNKNGITSPIDFFINPIEEVPEKTGWQSVKIAENLEWFDVDELFEDISKGGSSKNDAIDFLVDKGISLDQFMHCRDPLVLFNTYNETRDSVGQYHSKIYANPVYKRQGLEGTSGVISARKGVAEKIIEAANIIPTGYGILAYDGYRPTIVQQAIFDDFYAKIEAEIQIDPRKENETEEQWSERLQKHKEDLINETKKYASVPSTDRNAPSTHSTGGAFDFCICKEDTTPLNYGAEFDDVHEISSSRFFEDKLQDGINLTDDELDALINRRFLGNLAHYVGLTPFKYEWWHFNDPGSAWGLNFNEDSKNDNIRHTGAAYGMIGDGEFMPKPVTLYDFIKKSRKYNKQREYLVDPAADEQLL